MKPPPPFNDLRELSIEIHQYNSILGLLHWDQETYMPSGGINARSKQIAQLSLLVHEKKAGRKFKECLGKLVSLSTGKPKVKGLSKAHLAMIREWRKDYLRATKLPSSFVKNFSELTCQASQVWASAKQENNFKVFAPFLEKIIAMCRQKAEMFGFDEHPYDALLEGYEPCMTTRRVETIFSGLQKELTALLTKIACAKQVDDSFLHKKLDEEKQVELGRFIMTRLPMDMAYTRLDLSSHPFSMALHPHDSRITTRILEKNFMSNIFSVLRQTNLSTKIRHVYCTSVVVECAQVDRVFPCQPWM